MSLADTRLLARRCPACRWREPGLRLACGTWGRRVLTLRPARARGARGSAPSGRNRKALSTVAARAGGPARSSAEAPVMGAERRGWLICGLFARATGTAVPGGDE